MDLPWVKVRKTQRFKLHAMASERPRKDTVSEGHHLALRALELLRAYRTFERRHFDSTKTVEDRDLLVEIGYHAMHGRPLNQKRLLLLGVGSAATVQRRLRRLLELGAIRQQRCRHDRRSVELDLSPKLIAAFAKYGELLSRVSG